RNPSAGLLRGYDKRARAAFRRYQKARLKLADWARRKDELQEEAFREYQAVARDDDRALEFDAKGRVVVEVGAIPEEISARIRSEAVTINERLYVRDAFLELLPEVKEIHETESERIRVRTVRGAEEASRLLKLTEALLPYLEEDTGGRPTRRMNVFVFGTRRGFETYLDAAELGSHKVATGVADGARFVALVCGEGLDETSVGEVTCHELSHLFQFGVTPAVLPSWHREGFAETWGGPGTLSWNGEALEAGGMLAEHRLAPIRTDEGYIPLRDLLAGDALALLGSDRTRGSNFYAESWAFLRYMRHAAEEDVRERFHRWEVMCRGAALGAEPGKPNQQDSEPAALLFERMFAADLPAIEAGFREWLKGL
ncbi:MAG: hypothetical protein ACYTG6_14400, partial [Planctomycetota bacterium]